MNGFGWAALACQLPSTAAVVCAGWCAVTGRPWYVWLTFLFAAAFVGAELKWREPKK